MWFTRKINCINWLTYTYIYICICNTRINIGTMAFAAHFISLTNRYLQQYLIFLYSMTWWHGPQSQCDIPRQKILKIPHCLRVATQYFFPIDTSLPQMKHTKWRFSLNDSPIFLTFCVFIEFDHSILEMFWWNVSRFQQKWGINCFQVYTI